MRRVALVILALAACSSDEKKGPAPGGGDPVGAPAKAPTVTRDGKAVEIKAALAVSFGGKAVELTLASYPISCRDAAMGMEPMEESGRTQFRLVLAPMLRPTGASEWAIATTYFRGGNENREGAAIAGGPFDAAKDVAVDIPRTELTSAGQVKQTLVVEGPLVAKGCGIMQRHAAVKPRPQGELTFRIAGQTLPIAGAVLEHQGSDTVLRLATQPIDCSDAGFDSDLVWELYLTGGHPTRAQMRGTVLASQSSQMLRDQVSYDGGELRADYSQTGYAIQIAGRVDALECP
jgi:hypothetical protein